MAKKTYFISDVHLSIADCQEERDKRTKLIAFLQQIEKDAECLYILGDLFDFWFEWHHVIPKYFFSIFFQLKKLVDGGVKVILLAGNHDFKLEGYLNSSVGMITYSDQIEIKISNKKILLMHGDGWGKGDYGYKILKKIIRNPLSVFLFKNFIPADWGMWLAKKISNTSKSMESKDRSNWLRKYFLDRAIQKFKEGFDYVIIGHLHYPTRISEGGGELICLGDFMFYFSYLEFDGSKLLLKKLEN